MSSTARSQRLARMRAEEDFLALTEARLEAQRRADVAARERLAAAQAEADATRAEVQVLEERQRHLRHGIDELRAQHRRELWTHAIPLDCLRYIFEETTAISNDEWAHFETWEHSAARTSMPFTLASVCRRWRQLAVATPAVWTYISQDASPYGKSLSPRTLARISLLLLRSSCDRLDIRLKLDMCSSSGLSNMSTLLSWIAGHAPRIRSMHLHLPKTAMREPHMDMFKAPLPSITHLCIVVSSGNAWELNAHGGYFPYAPKLEYLKLESTGITCSPPYQNFGSLRELVLFPPCTQAQVVPFLIAASPTLERLYLGSTKLITATTPNSITFPRLSSLASGGASFSSALCDMMRTPALQSLSMPGWTVVESFTRLFEHTAKDISSITLVGDCTQGSTLGVLQMLHNVQTLCFSDNSQYLFYDVSNDFFEELATASPPIWPKLRSIRLDASVSSKSKFGDGLLSLIRARNLPEVNAIPNAEPEARPCKLEAVDLQSPSTPLWLRSAVDHIMMLSSCS